MKTELYNQFKKENPQTVGENDKEFDMSNYIEWLEHRLIAIHSTSEPEQKKPLSRGILEVKMGENSALNNEDYCQHSRPNCYRLGHKWMCTECNKEWYC